MSTVDDLTGVLGTVVVAGVTMKMADKLFDQKPKIFKRKKTVKKFKHPGNFSNLGF